MNCAELGEHLDKFKSSTISLVQTCLIAEKSPEIVSGSGRYSRDKEQKLKIAGPKQTRNMPLKRVELRK